MSCPLARQPKSSHLSPVLFPACSCCSKSHLLWASRTACPRSLLEMHSLCSASDPPNQRSRGLPLALEGPTLCCSRLPQPPSPQMALTPSPLPSQMALPPRDSIPPLAFRSPSSLESLPTSLRPPGLSPPSPPWLSRALVLAQSPLSLYPLFVGHFLESVYWSIVALQRCVSFRWALPWQFHPTSWSQPTSLCRHKSRYVSPSLRTDVSLLSTPTHVHLLHQHLSQTSQCQNRVQFKTTPTLVIQIKLFT